MSQTKYLLLLVNGRHEIQECQLQDLDQVAERLSKEGMYLPSSTDIKIIYTPGYLNFLRTGVDEEDEDYLYHVPIKLVGSQLESVDEQDEGHENGESWKKTDLSLSLCGGTRVFCVRDWEILTHGEVKDSYGIPLGKGFLMINNYLYEWHPYNPPLSHVGLPFIINNGRVEAWPSVPNCWNCGLVGISDPAWDTGSYSSWEVVVKAKAVQDGRGALWVLQRWLYDSLYYTPNNYSPPNLDSSSSKGILIKDNFTGQHFGFFNTSLDEDRIFYEENKELVVLKPGGEEITRFPLSEELRSNADLDNPLTGAYIGDELYIVGGLSYDSPSPQKWMSFYTNIWHGS